MQPVIDIIVRTQADTGRADALFRGLDTIQKQAGVRARPIVVVNGPRADDAVLARLHQRPGIRVYRIAQASQRLARAMGRKLVTAPYFGYLDDDDELVEDSLEAPLRWLEEHVEDDGVVTNGYFAQAGTIVAPFAESLTCPEGPCSGLLQRNWLVPGAFVLRTERVPSQLLASRWGSFEWTELAFELCARHQRIHFMDVLMVRYNDTPDSRSKQKNGRVALVMELMQKVARDTRHDLRVRRGARRKYLLALHRLAWSHWLAGQRARAWRYHVASLRPPGTWKYLFFSRKLLRPGRKGLTER